MTGSTRSPPTSLITTRRSRATASRALASLRPRGHPPGGRGRGAPSWSTLSRLPFRRLDRATRWATRGFGNPQKTRLQEGAPRPHPPSRFPQRAGRRPRGRGARSSAWGVGAITGESWRRAKTPPPTPCCGRPRPRRLSACPRRRSRRSTARAGVWRGCSCGYSICASREWSGCPWPAPSSWLPTITTIWTAWCWASRCHGPSRSSSCRACSGPPRSTRPSTGASARSRSRSSGRIPAPSSACSRCSTTAAWSASFRRARSARKAGSCAAGAGRRWSRSARACRWCPPPSKAPTRPSAGGASICRGAGRSRSGSGSRSISAGRAAGTPPGKAWSGRFAEGADPTAEAFTASLSFDRRLWPYDLAGSAAWARALARAKLITEAELESLSAGLEAVRRELEGGTFPFRRELEDIHMNVERRLVELAGPVGGKLHTGRSRNDQIALDERLYLRDVLDHVDAGLVEVERALVAQAEKHGEAPMPGYTHLQRAQPVLLAHHLLAYVFMLERDRARFRDGRARVNVMPLGAAALAGTAFAIDREALARDLGMSAPSPNSMDAVADRDFLVEFLSHAAILGMHGSRLAADLTLWATAEFGFVEFSDAFATGSSIMPQKKNPDVAELIRGKTGRLYGNLVAVLATMKGLPLTYNSDMQEDKELADLPLEELRRFSPLIEKDVHAALTVEASLQARSVIGGTAPEAVARALAEARKRIPKERRR